LRSGCLALELAPTVETVSGERSVADRGLHRTAGFALVATVAETALTRERVDVGKCLVESRTTLPQPELAHAGRVDDQPRAGDRDELANRGRVSTAIVTVANRA